MAENDIECGCYLAKMIPWCIDSILVPQIESVNYTAEITDHHNNKYTVDLVDKKILLTDLPDGIFSPYSGSYTLKVYQEGNTEPFEFTFDSGVYDCIILRFQDSFPVIQEGVID